MIGCSKHLVIKCYHGNWSMRENDNISMAKIYIVYIYIYIRMYIYRDEAVVEYLKIAQDLEMYGVNYFEIKVTLY